MFDNITKVAAVAPVFAAIYFTMRGFAGLGMTFELVAILTTLFGCLSWLSSQAILRFLKVRHNPPMAAAVVALGVTFAAAETFFAHLGLEWLLAQGEGIEAPAALIWFFSSALAVTNVVAKWAFIGDPGRPKRKPSSAQNIVSLDAGKDEATIAKIGERIREAM